MGGFNVFTFTVQILQIKDVFFPAKGEWWRIEKYISSEILSLYFTYLLLVYAISFFIFPK